MRYFPPLIRPLARAGWFLACVVLAQAAEAESRVVRVLSPGADPAFEGWGTSLCWFANSVGRWPEPQRSALADALFSDRGLRLNIVRYNIGGGENPAHHHMPWFRQLEGFEPSAGAWDWSADPGQRWLLAAARRRGVDRIEAFSNSPPYWMTLSGCASGGTDPNRDNLDPGREAAFVDYLVQVAEHFRTAWGVRFDTIDPLNEPFTDYWRAFGNQEGCHFDRATQARVLRDLRTALDQHGLSSIGISAADETNFATTLATWEAYDAVTRAAAARINTHAYATERRAELRALARALGKPLVMSEVEAADGDTHDHAAIGPALSLAGRIIDDLRDLRPRQWIDWQAVEDEAAQAAAHQNWGLIHADLQGDSHAWSPTKKFYALGNFSKFIRPGAVLVSCDDPDTVAAYDRARDLLVIVTRNPRPDDRAIIYDLGALAGGARRRHGYRTSADEDLAPLPEAPVVSGRYTAVARGRSITTFVLAAVAD